LEQNKKYFADLNPPVDFWRYVQAQLDVPGTAEAIRDTMRHAPVQSFVDSYGELGKLNLPVRAIWGKKDATFPYANHEILAQQVPGLELYSVDAAAHLPQLEQHARVTPVLIDFLRSFANRASSVASPRLVYSGAVRMELSARSVDNAHRFDD